MPPSSRNLLVHPDVSIPLRCLLLSLLLCVLGEGCSCAREAPLIAVSGSTAPEETMPGDEVVLRAVLANPTKDPVTLQATLLLHAPDGRTLETREWTRLSLAAEQSRTEVYAYRVPLDLPPGSYRALVKVVDEAGRSLTEPEETGLGGFQVVEARPAAPSPARCRPKTCAGQQRSCGVIPDGCGGLRVCGACERLALSSNWRIQSSAQVSEGGAQVSMAGYSSADWIPATVPGTVLANLVQNGEYPGLFFSNRLAQVDRSRFAVPWWYRTEFTLPADPRKSSTVLHLDGLNYRAEVWVNGSRVIGANEAAGTFRTFALDVTAYVKPGETNAVAIQVSPPAGSHSLTWSWVDWNPEAPDLDMGLWNDVYLTQSGPLAFESSPQVTARVGPDLETAHLTVQLEVRNTTDAPLTATVRGGFDTVSFQRELTLGARERRELVFTEQDVPGLRVPAPRLWWPRPFGSPERYMLDVQAEAAGVPSDARTVAFGIREITSELTAEGHRLFRVNGRPLLIRGAGWARDLLLRAPAERVNAQLDYVEDLGLNTLRLEGQLESEAFYEETDRRGLLVLPGWVCCSPWERWAEWPEENFQVAERSMESQARLLRVHPSVAAFLVGSDVAPPSNVPRPGGTSVDVERLYVDALHAARWPNPIIPSASSRPATHLGAGGMKMEGPYGWVPPVYWFADTSRGGAFGFASEMGPGAAIPSVEALERMLAPDELEALWKRPGEPQYHAGTSPPSNSLADFHFALTHRYGAPGSLEDYVAKAQLSHYETERAMYEAFSRNKYAPATGVIQWMLNSAWPSLHWNLFDYELGQEGAYFGVKKANEPLHIQYSYDDHSVVAVNQTLRPAEGLTATARLFELDGQERWSASVAMELSPDSARRLFPVPLFLAQSALRFLVLTLRDANANVMSRNVYWLSAQPDVMDWSASSGWITLQAGFADHSALGHLPPASVAAWATGEVRGPDGALAITLENRSDTMAFFVRLEVMSGGALAGSSQELRPTLWEDNDITLAPGERRVIRALHPAEGLTGPPMVRLRGWNVEPQWLPVAAP